MSLKEFLSKVLRKAGLPLLAVSLLFHFLDERLVELTQAELFSQEGASIALWIYGGLSMIVSMIGPLILLVLILAAISDRERFNFVKNNFGYLLKEQMRGFGKVFLWGLLLVIPGFWKFLQILFLPFVVGLDPAYQRGEIDALDSSRAIFQKNRGKTLGLFVLFGLFIPMMMTYFDEYRDAQEHLFTWGLLVMADLAIFLLFQFVLLKIWARTVPTPLPQSS